MCGIAGWVDFTRDLTDQRVIALAMTETMACRGPDAQGLWIDRHVALGHRRLGVIDLAGGVQPMAASTLGRRLATLSFCGEVYNFRQLRTELEGLGHTFRTASDTEVVLHAFLQWGENFAARLTGMFSIALWDAPREELLLVRDRMGVKPLYYQPTHDGVLFGSEPKAILAHPAAGRRVDAVGLCEMLEMVKTPGAAVFADMREVRPGEIVRVSRAGLSQRRFWSLPAREHNDSLDTTIETVRTLLAGIVDGQLVSDVPVGTLLSGGLDSSAVTALAAASLTAQGQGAVRSFSVDFAGSAERFEPDAVRTAPDAPFVAALAEHVGADHHSIVLDDAEMSDPAVRAAVLQATDTPPAYWGDMWPSLYLLFKAVRAHVTVALSGEAADELFGGYQWFRNPAALRADTFPWLTRGSSRYFGGWSLLDRGFLQKLDLPGYRADRYAEALAEVPVLDGEDAIDRRMREVTYLNVTRFMQTLLDRKDRMSMAVGLEVRVPFCDHHLAEYVFNVPWAMKSFDGREKSLLRAAVRDVLPQSVVERVKTPYPATQNPAYAQALRTELAAVVADRNAPVLPLLDPERVRKELARPQGATSMPYDRGGLEMALWLNRWLTEYRVTLDL